MSKELIELFECMKKSVQTIGAKKTSNLLKSYNNSKDDNVIIINFIVDIVIQDSEGQFKTKSELFKLHIRGDASVYRNMIIVLVSKCTVLSSKQISAHLKNVSGDTVRSVVSHYNKLDRKNKFDRKIIDRHELLLEKVLKYTNK